MKKIITLGLVLGAGICINVVAFADDIQFTTLPQTVQTTVIRESHIANPTYVTRVVRDDSGVYAVTYRASGGDQVVYVNSEGAIAQPSSATTRTTTTTTTVQQPVQTTEPAEGAVVTYDQVEQDLPRYQLLEKKGRKRYISIVKPAKRLPSNERKIRSSGRFRSREHRSEEAATDRCSLSVSWAKRTLALYVHQSTHRTGAHARQRASYRTGVGFGVALTLALAPDSSFSSSST